MTFSSLTYVLFLPLVFLLYWSLRRRGQNLLLVTASYVFYGWWDWRFCGLMAASSLVDYFVGLGLRGTAVPGRRRALLLISLVCNLGLLGFFKYFGFFAENLVVLAEAVGWHLDPVTLQVVLPVGISFYTFQTLSYTIDVYRGHLRATDQFVDYLAYVSFFPQLVAGPIERATRLLPQFLAERRFDRDLAVGGCELILWGFTKKLLVADRLAPIVDATFLDVDGAGGPRLVFATVCFALQIYSDFSAYSDIAVGTGRLFGIRLMRNFAYPYFSRSVGEFWRRWHISLSTWFRDYVYVPLGGSRTSRRRMLCNVLVTFTISGLWHGASWNFVVWGALMGLFVVPDVMSSARQRRGPRDTAGAEGLWPGLANLGRMTLTFALICLGWVFFRSATLHDATTAIAAMTTELFQADAWQKLGVVMDDSEGRRGLLLIPGLLLVEWLTRRHRHPLQFGRLPRVVRWTLYTLLMWGILLHGPRNVSTFIYFQF